MTKKFLKLARMSHGTKEIDLDVKTTHPATEQNQNPRPHSKIGLKDRGTTKGESKPHYFNGREFFVERTFKSISLKID